MLVAHVFVQLIKDKAQGFGNCTQSGGTYVKKSENVCVT
jgi:hypothetical protein